MNDPGGDSEFEASIDGFLDDLEQSGRLHELEECIEVLGAAATRTGSRLGSFELVRPLGRGGMGAVWEAVHTGGGAGPVALKILTRFSPQSARRFQREIASIGSLEHDGIVGIVASGFEGSAQDGVPYFAMELIDGLGLDHLIGHLSVDPRAPEDTRRVREMVRLMARDVSSDSSERAPTPATSAWEHGYFEWVARLGELMADALQHAHDRGVVHRDVKPGNVVVTPSGRPVLIDFGLSSLDGDETLTREGDFFGSLAYASPEQVRGEPLGPRGDVYALGATLFELLTLHRPFYGATRSELMRRIQQDDPAPFEGPVPVELRLICLQAMRKRPSSRYASAAALAADLRAFLDGRSIQARPPGVVARSRRWIRRNPLKTVAVTVAILALLLTRFAAHARAARHVEAGLVLLDEARERVAHRRALLDRRAQVIEARRSGRPASLNELERLRAEIRGEGDAIELAKRRAESSLRTAFEHVAGHRRARAGLERLFVAELRYALHELADLYDPARVARLEASLAGFAAIGDHADLVGHTGSATLDSDPPGARVMVRAPDGSTTAGPTPLELKDVPEGTYVARFTRTASADAVLPFRIRRDACYAEDGALPARERVVQLVGADQIAPGFVYVPAGWTLVEDAPPRWEWVDSFQILESEVSYERYVGWANRLLELGRRRPTEPGDLVEKLGSATTLEFKPRFHDREGEQHVRFDRSTGLLTLVREEPRRPVRALKVMEMERFANELERLLPRALVDWQSSLPTASEWVRAFRGEDARTYPWGEGFSTAFCGAYGSLGSDFTDPSPYVVGSFEHDVSPFGVRDMAGSIAEATRDLAGHLPGIYRVCGGSYKRRNPADFAATALRGEDTGLHNDVGFRVVLRPYPDWSGTPDAEPHDFTDTFDRPDGPDVGAGWLEFLGNPLNIPTNPHGSEMCRIEGGALVCEGGRGNFSKGSEAWRRVHVGSKDFTVRATVTGRFDTSGRVMPGPALFEGVGCRAKRRIGIMLTPENEMQLWSSWSAVPVVHPCDLTHRESVVMELRIAGPTVEARVWAVGAERPRESLGSIERPLDWQARWLVLFAPNAVGARMTFGDVSVRLARD